MSHSLALGLHPTGPALCPGPVPTEGQAAQRPALARPHRPGRLPAPAAPWTSGVRLDREGRGQRAAPRPRLSPARLLACLLLSWVPARAPLQPLPPQTENKGAAPADRKEGRPRPPQPRHAGAPSTPAGPPALSGVSAHVPDGQRAAEGLPAGSCLPGASPRGSRSTAGHRAGTQGRGQRQLAGPGLPRSHLPAQQTGVRRWLLLRRLQEADPAPLLTPRVLVPSCPDPLPPLWCLGGGSLPPGGPPPAAPTQAGTSWGSGQRAV